MKERINHLWRGTFVILAAVVAGRALAVLPAKTPPLDNYDRRIENRQRVPAVSDQAKKEAAAKLESAVPRVTVTRDEITGTAKWVSNPTDFLSGPQAQGKAIPAAALRGLEQDPHRAVKAFLNEHSRLFGHDSAVLREARIKREFVTPHTGMRTVIWEQQVDGIPVFEGLLTAHVTKREELVSISSHFIPNPAEAATAGSGRQAADRSKPKLNAAEAVARAAKDIDVVVSVTDITAKGAHAERPEIVKHAAPGLAGDTETSLVWLPLDGTKLRLCWQVILTSQWRGEMYRVLLDADDGTPLLRQCLTTYISDATYRVYPSDSPSPFSPGHPTPLTNQPPLTSRVLITTPALNTNASPNGWINDGVNETRGNNVDAHLDRNNDNLPDLPRPAGSPNRVFDFPMDLTQAPVTYGNAAVVQLFYWNNWVHDKLYELGFTEAAGNFQIDNFGRGGLGNDAVNADAQDGLNIGNANNANMSTPPDGSPPRMQMYVFDGPTPDRDGDFDTEIVIHEYVHGLSNRRVGGGVGISQLQSAGMGEGWSDFYGLAMLSESGDDIHANYAVGGYATFQFFGLLQNYYFGIRRYPYSTDMTKNPLTFKDIDPTQADPHSGIPISPVFGGPGNPAAVHNQGEVWCVTLWEARANLIEKHGFAAGNQLILRLVTDGMTLSPANPNFLQARDAIIQADRVLTGGANFNELWRAFAKRGMGFSATSPASSTTTGVRESFDVPDDLLVLPNTGLVMIGPVGGPFAPTGQLYSLTNISSSNSVIWRVLASAPWLDVSNSNGTLPPGSPATTVLVSVNAGADLLAMGLYTATVTFTNETTRRAQARQVSLVVGQVDHFTERFDTDNDLDFQMFTFTPDGSPSFYSLCRETVSAFPVDPRDAKPILLSDDSFIFMQLAGGARVSLYGRSTNAFFLGSNGYITFGQGDANLGGSLDAHFALRRISALFTDLNPGAGGSVSWQQMADCVVVTFQNVPLFGAADSNSFQYELFYDGRIRITYLRIDITHGLAGLSAGEGVPFGFQESNLSSYPTCSARLLVSLPSAATEGDGSVAGLVSLPVPAASNLLVTLRSSKPEQLSVPGTVQINAGASNAAFSAMVNDDANLDGSQGVTVTASRIGFNSHSALITVHDNENGQLTLIAPTQMGENVTTQVTVTTAAPVSAPVRVALMVSEPARLQAPDFVFIPAGATQANFPVTALDNQDIEGPRSVAISANVQNWSAATSIVQIVDDEMTVLSVALPSELSESAGAVLQRASVSISGLLASDLVVTLTSSDPMLLSVPPSVVIVAGQLSARFDLTLSDDDVLSGNRSVTVGASASGWTPGADTVLVTDDESPPAPVLPSPAHLSSNNAVTVDLSWRSPDSESLVNGGFETGTFSGWTVVTTGPGNFVINDGTVDPPFGTDGPLPPFSGSFAVIGNPSGPGTHTIYQDVVVPANSATLQWAHRIRNHSTQMSPSQGFRVEIRDTSDAVLAELFTTQPTDVFLQPWTEHSADLSAFAGQLVRLAFVQTHIIGPFNAHIDAVTMSGPPPQPTSYDVYFGVNPTPGPAEFLGNTTNLSWALPNLAPLTTYYWQIVARRLGATPGPIWQFTTRGVDHFDWSPIASPQQINVAFPVTLTARDEFNAVVTNFTGPVLLNAISQGATNPASPPMSGSFVDGVWNGAITIADPAPSLLLQASDGQGHFGLSTPFAVNAADDVSIAMSVNPNPVLAFRQTAVTLTVHNSGPSAANALVVSNALAGSLSFLSASTTHGSCSNASGTVICDLGTLAGEQTAVITINVTPTMVGTVTNIATISRGEQDTTAINNTARQIITVAPAVSLSIISVTTNETAGIISIQARLNQPSTVPVSFSFYTESAVATAGADFVSTNGTVVLPAGVTNRAVLLQVLDDSLDEITEHFLFVVTNVVNAVLAQNNHTVTILDNDPPPTVSIGDASIAEGDSGHSEIRFPITLSQASGANVTVSYNTTAGSAVAGADFVATNGVVVLPAGVVTGEVTVLVRGDALDELNETFSVNLFNPINATLLDSLGTGTIQDDDPLPLLRVVDASFPEGQTNSTQLITVELSAVSGVSLTVNYATSNGTAVAASDYGATSGILTFAPGTLTRTIPITIIGDTNNEGHERFSVLLSSPVRAVIDDGVGSVTLRNDDAPPGELDYFAWDPIAGPQYIGQPFSVTVRAIDFSGNPATTFTGPASLAADPSLAISPAVSGMFVGGVWTGDVTVSQPAPAARLIASDTPAHTGTSNPFDIVATNDIAVLVSAAPQPVSVLDTLTLLLVATNTGPDSATGVVVSNTLPAHLEFVSATSSQGACSNAGNLVICALGSIGGAAKATISISALAQTAGIQTNAAAVHRDGTDTYAPNNAAFTPVHVLPTPSISIANLSVLEPDTNNVSAVFQISLSHPSSRPVSVAFSTQPLSAGPADFIGRADVLIVPPGITNPTIDITVLGDLLDEGLESFTLTLANPTNAVLGSAVGTATIQDQDPSAPISISDVTVLEGNPPDDVFAVFTVSLSRTSSLPISVTATTQNGSAFAGTDFAATNLLLHLPPGATGTTISVRILPDLIDEIDETFAVNLSSPTNTSLADFRGVATILDDDAPPLVMVSHPAVVEGDSGSTTGRVQLILSNPSSRTVSLSYLLQDGTAAAASDYLGASGVITFAANVRTQLVAVTILGDPVRELDENFFMTFFNPSNATLSELSAEITIINDDALPGQLESFTWAPIASPRRAGTAFPATAFARDFDGGPATNFSGSVMLRARASEPPVQIGSGSEPWHYPLSTFFHDARSQVIYLAGELGPTQRIAALSLNITAVPGQILNNWTIRMKHTTRSNYAASPLWESTGWTTVYQRNTAITQPGWTEFPFTTVFNYNGSNNVLIDFSFNNASFTLDGTCLASLTPQPRSLTFRSDSASGDPLLWSGSSPVPIVHSRIPNLRLQPLTAALPVTPTTAGPFLSGVWMGSVTVLAPGTNVQLVAEDALGHFGFSDRFDVRPANTPIVLSILRHEGSVHIAWESIVGRTYRVDVNESLDDTWDQLSMVTGAGPIATATDVFDPEEQRFYRVVELP